MDNQNEEVSIEEIKALKKYREGAMGIVGSVICFVFGVFFLLISLLSYVDSISDARVITSDGNPASFATLIP